jgi:transposase InsO family protein
MDRSSRPHTGRRTDAAVTARVLALRNERRTIQQIASLVSSSRSTVARICGAAGISRLRSLEPQPPIIRYERDNPGDLLHFDIKRLGRFDRVGHRITRERSHGSAKQGWEFLHVAVDDASRVAYAEILADESGASASMFLRAAVAWFARLDVTVERVLTDNGSGYVSRQFGATCADLGIRHKRTRPYTPRTNGKVERFIQTMLREWVYRFTYTSSSERRRWLTPYLHFYNCHRAHTALAYYAPVSRLDGNNVLTRNS